MPQTLGMPTYFNLKEVAVGTQLVSKGEYCGAVPSPKFRNNMQHNFYEVDGNRRHVILSGGQLDWRVKQGDLKVGGVYDIYFDGEHVIEKGQWAGTKAKQFRIDTYSKQEIKELIGDGAELRGVLDQAEEIELAPEQIADSSEDLGALE